MGFTITIGEAVASVYEYGDGYGGEAYVDAAGVKDHPEAPSIPNDVNDRCNFRWPSYTTWHEFARAVGLHDFFFDKETGLMREHPGAFGLIEEHHSTIREALAKYRREHPDAVAGFAREKRDENGRWIFGEYEDEHYDPMLGRLVWLEWWVRWALANCKVPVVHNS